MSGSSGTDTNNHFVEESSVSKTSVKPKNTKIKTKNSKHMNKVDDRRHRRPDMKLYVPPKAKTNNSIDETEDQSSAQSLDQKTFETTESLSELEISDSSHPKANNNCLTNHLSNDLIVVESKETSIATIESNSQKSSQEVEDECSWDTLFDENGDCIRQEFVDKVNDLICDKNCDLKLEKPRIDYFSFQYTEPEIDNSEFAHILEVYDFAIELKTQDIMTSISVFNCRDFDIKWVDDSHALIVFSNANAANEALKYVYPNIKLRPLSQAFRESKLKARKCSEFLQPYKQRPQTSASLARRLVTQSLGLRERITPEQRAAERKKLAEAKEKKRMAIKQGIDVWEGNVS